MNQKEVQKHVAKQKWRDELERLAWRITRNISDVQEIVQEAYTRVWELSLEAQECPKTGVEFTNLRAYLMAIVRNESLSVLRKRDVRRRYEKTVRRLFYDAEEMGAEDWMLREEAFVSALERMTEAQVEAVHALLSSGSVSAASVVLGLSVSAVSQRLKRAKEVARKVLDGKQ